LSEEAWKNLPVVKRKKEKKMAILMPVEKIDIPAALQRVSEVADKPSISVIFEPIGDVCKVFWIIEGNVGLDSIVVTEDSLKLAVEKFVHVATRPKVTQEEQFDEAAKQIRADMAGDAGDAHTYAMAAKAAGIDWKWQNHR